MILKNKWSNEFPTEDGWYWFVGTINKYNHPIICKTPSVVGVSYYEDDQYRDYTLCGSEIIYYDEHMHGIFLKIEEPDLYIND